VPSKEDPARGSRPVSRRSFLQGASAAAAVTILATRDAPSQIQIDREIAGRPKTAIRLRVNGATFRLNVEASATLLDTLRDQLDLTGPKRVCDRGECGACTVLLDGQPIYACMKLAVDAQGHEITTVESLSAGGAMHPLQQAFVEHDATQCGFCTSGMVITLKALLDRNPDPSEHDVRAAIAGNLCKCGTYPKIFRATLDAAKTLRGGK
jgi:xanthine dehydrogenase YagT iron-sulfur-binding subunit